MCPSRDHPCHAVLTCALPVGDGARLVLHARALLPDAAGHGADPASAARRKLTGVDWGVGDTAHPAHVRRRRRWPRLAAAELRASHHGPAVCK